MTTTTPAEPSNVKSTVTDRTRPKDFLTPAEVERLLDATKGSKHRIRDRAILLMMYRHGLRVSELTALRREHLDLAQSRLWINRHKNGLSVEQPVEGDELRAIKRYLATRTDKLPWLFVSERGTQLVRQTVNYLIAECTARAGLTNVHPHTLRHSCGFYLANKGYDSRLIGDYLGHRDANSTIRYTRVASHRFEGLWR